MSKQFLKYWTQVQHVLMNSDECLLPQLCAWKLIFFVLTLPIVKIHMGLKSHSLIYYKSVHQEEMVILYSQGMWCRRNSLVLVINCVHVAASCAVHEERPADGDWLPQSTGSRQSSLWFYVRRLRWALWETEPSVMLPSPYLPLSRHL